MRRRSSGKLTRMPAELPELLVVDARAWRAWLNEHHQDSTGVWLVLAKQGATSRTSLNYDQALDEALSQGWIDGQARRRDHTTYRRRFTRRTARSSWSKRNVGLVERLVAEGLMPAGRARCGRAGEGRWSLGGRIRRTGRRSRCLLTWRSSGRRASRTDDVRDPHEPEPVRRPPPSPLRQAGRHPSKAG